MSLSGVMDIRNLSGNKTETLLIAVEIKKIIDAPHLYRSLR